MIYMNSTKRNSLLAVLVLIGIFSFSAFLKINSIERIPLCFFKYLTHLDCPGCGLTRSFIAISHGDWKGALHFNVLGPFIYLYLLFYLIKHLIFLIWNQQLSWQMPLWFQWSFGLLFLGQWIWKLMIGLNIV